MKTYNQVANTGYCFVPISVNRARVLQRSTTLEAPLSFNSLKFEIAFNLAVIWMLIFVALGKGNTTFDWFHSAQFIQCDSNWIHIGLRSYGKVVYAFGTVPLLGYFVVCVKILSISSSVPSLGVAGVLEMTPWNEFFTDTRVSSFYFSFHILVENTIRFYLNVFNGWFLLRMNAFFWKI